jgi:predicted metal-dependent hydrolase
MPAVQPVLPFDEASVSPASDGGPRLVFVRHRRARRYILRVLPDGTLRVTVPRWGSQREARQFVTKSQTWVERQRARQAAQPAPDRRWRAGRPVLVDGQPQELSLDWHGGLPVVSCGAARVPLRGEVDPDDLRVHVERWLYGVARQQLPPALVARAETHGLVVRRISIRDQQSRWGACSRRGTVTLNWRLVQVPPFVRDYVLLHELMHLREMNHSARFWRLVARACPDYQEARRWLRTEGSALF